MNFILIAFFLVFPCSSHAQNKPRVVTTVGMITDAVQNVANDKINVVGIIGAGVDPHLYKATRSDIATLSGADIIFYNGLLLEGKLSDALVRVATSGKKVFAVTEQLEPSYLLSPPEFGGHHDPHVWMDPTAWKKTVKVIVAKLSEYSPNSAAFYEEQAGSYIKKLEELDNYSEKVLKTIPAELRVLVTAHDAFNYFGKRYGFEVLGIQGISTESEAGVKDIERLVTVLVEKKIKAVFVESTVSQRNIQALIEGAKAQGHSVAIGGQLFSDAMGKPGTYEGTYIGMIDHNVTTIARALGGNAPKTGFNGKLTGID